MIAKPEVNKIHERARVLYSFIKNNKIVTKEQCAKFLNWEYNKSNERRVREIISYIAQRVPVISTSDEKGYSIASIDNQELIIKEIRELQSRIDEIKKRIEPLIKFCNENKINSLNK